MILQYKIHDNKCLNILLIIKQIFRKIENIKKLQLFGMKIIKQRFVGYKQIGWF